MAPYFRSTRSLGDPESQSSPPRFRAAKFGRERHNAPRRPTGRVQSPKPARSDSTALNSLRSSSNFTHSLFTTASGSLSKAPGLERARSTSVSVASPQLDDLPSPAPPPGRTRNIRQRSAGGPELLVGPSLHSTSTLKIEVVTECMVVAPVRPIRVRRRSPREQ